MEGLYLEDEFLLSDSHFIYHRLRILDFLLKCHFCVALILNLVMQLLNGVTASQQEQVSLLLLGIALVSLLAAICERGLADSRSECGIRQLLIAQLIDAKLSVSVAPFRLICLSQSASQCLSATWLQLFGAKSALVQIVKRVTHFTGHLLVRKLRHSKRGRWLRNVR